MDRYTVGDIIGIELETGDVTAPEILTVNPDHTLRETLGLMSRKDYSQIGVGKSGSLSGIVTYHSIIRALRVVDEIDVENESWRDRSTEIAAIDPNIISNEEHLLNIFEYLTDEQYVLVEADSSGLPHIVTDYDVHHFLQTTIEPFLLIEEIENSLRNLLRTVIGDSLSEKLQKMSAENESLRDVSEVNDCSFSHYQIFISMHWSQFGSYFSQRQDFTTRLIKRIGALRNELFHFRTGRKDEFDLDMVRFGHRYLTGLSGNRDLD